jgi:hypothetical protein
MIVNALQHIAAIGNPEKIVRTDEDLHEVLCAVEIAPCANAM